jgi:hypothetical protein
MKRIFTLLLVCISTMSFGQCESPSAIEPLDINNVAAWIHNGQYMWTFGSNAGYEVPKGEGVSALYGGNFWIGGVSPDQQLKIAGGTYPSDGYDFYPGPLSDDGSAQTTPEACLQYDRIWTIYRAEVEQHIAYFDCLNDVDCDVDTEYPYGYDIPSEFIDYPAHGDVNLGQAYNLAPWYDYDQDGIYDPNNGDCPLFDFMSDDMECGVCSALKGDMCLYWIDNDKGSVHLATQGEPIGIEIHNMAYAFASQGVMNNTTMYCKRVINRGTQTTSDTQIGLWVDGDLGNSTDDYVGCDIDRDMTFFYNGDDFDEVGFGTEGYGENPPAIGVRMLTGPQMDLDDYDNDGDGIIDNENLWMTSHMAYSNQNGPYGEPTSALAYYNLMKSIWGNGEQLMCATNPDEETDWMYGGDTYPDDCGPVTELGVQNPPGDRRSILGSGPFTYEPGMEKHIEYAVVWARPDPLADIDAVQNLQLASDSVSWYYEDCFGCLPPGVAIMVEQVGPFTYTFANYGQGDVVEWSFGDGNTSDETMPTHTYAGNGEYEVSLTVDGECGTATTGTTVVESMEVGIGDPEDFSLVVMPNPASETITLGYKSGVQLQLQIFDALGRNVMSRQVNSNEVLNISYLSTGHYVLKIATLDGQSGWTQKLIKK